MESESSWEIIGEIGHVNVLHQGVRCESRDGNLALGLSSFCWRFWLWPPASKSAGYLHFPPVMVLRGAASLGRPAFYSRSVLPLPACLEPPSSFSFPLASSPAPLGPSQQFFENILYSHRYLKINELTNTS